MNIENKIEKVMNIVMPIWVMFMALVVAIATTTYLIHVIKDMWR